MGRFYGERIRKGDITLDDVPSLWQNATKKWIFDNP